MDVVDHMSVASTNRSVAVLSTSLRSCLKKPNNSAAKSDRTGRNVQIAEFDWVFEIESLKGHLYLWAAKGEHKQCRKQALNRFQTDATVRLYIRVHDAAYVQLNSGNGDVSNLLECALIRGVVEDYRTLESYSKKRRHTRIDHSKSVLAVYKRLLLETRMGDDNSDWVTQQLREHSERLSLNSRRWSVYMGFVDECAVAVENASSPPEDSNLPPSAPSVVTAEVNVPRSATPMQNQKSLVYEFLAVKHISKDMEQTLTIAYRKEPRQDELRRELSLVPRQLRPNAYHGGNNWNMKGFLGSAMKRHRGRKVHCFE